MNTLFYGDNLDILRQSHLIAAESVDLCYIDPPFNSNRAYSQIYNRVGKEDLAQAQAFTDTWTWNERSDAALDELLGNDAGRFSSQTVNLAKGLLSVLGRDSLMAYLLSMTLRIQAIHRVLKPTGSFYLHVDPTASHYLKLVCDSIFLPEGGEYRNEIIWKRTSGHSDAVRYGNVHDTILYYVKSASNYVWNPVFEKFDEKYVEQYYRYKDADGRRFMSGDLSAAGLTGGGYTYEWKSVTRVWRCPETTMQRLEDENRIFYTRNGMPRMKRYLDESKGLPAGDVWTDIESLRSWHKERLGYPTQKPESLLKRILEASTNEGDVVLDAYCGCGTTVAVAQRLGRRWLGIDITYQSIALVLRRLEAQFGADVLNQIKFNGIPRDMASATNLALRQDDRTRKEFEKWAVLTFSDNRAQINDKKGADGGIDGQAFSQTGGDSNVGVALQVKSGNVKSGDVDALRGVMAKFNCEMGVLLTLQEPSKPMREAASAAGTYKHPFMDKPYPCIRIVTIREMLEDGARLNLPLPVDVLKRAARHKDASQAALMLDD